MDGQELNFINKKTETQKGESPLKTEGSWGLQRVHLRTPCIRIDRASCSNASFYGINGITPFPCSVVVHSNRNPHLGFTVPTTGHRTCPCRPPTDLTGCCSSLRSLPTTAFFVALIYVTDVPALRSCMSYSACLEVSSLKSLSMRFFLHIWVFEKPYLVYLSNCSPVQLCVHLFYLNVHLT